MTTVMQKRRDLESMQTICTHKISVQSAKPSHAYPIIRASDAGTFGAEGRHHDDLIMALTYELDKGGSPRVRNTLIAFNKEVIEVVYDDKPNKYDDYAVKEKKEYLACVIRSNNKTTLDNVLSIAATKCATSLNEFDTNDYTHPRVQDKVIKRGICIGGCDSLHDLRGLILEIATEKVSSTSTLSVPN